MGILFWVGRTQFDAFEMQEWLWETWRFVKQIFPLLVVGVFIVGVLRPLIKPEWIQAVAGRNTLLGNLAGVVFGVFMYFPTLVEVPVAQMFMHLGMHRGPLLAYLLADPELSLQSILITASIIGKGKAWVYVVWVAVFSTLAGLIYGAWVDGAPAALFAPLPGRWRCSPGGHPGRREPPPAPAGTCRRSPIVAPIYRQGHEGTCTCPPALFIHSTFSSQCIGEV